jgi:hypothetical protein
MLWVPLFDGPEDPVLLVLFSIIGLCGLAGIYRSLVILSRARAKGFFHAGPEGIKIQVPRDGLFRMPLGYYEFPWNDVEGVQRYRASVNGIPTQDELRIFLRGYAPFKVASFWFDRGVDDIRDDLLRMRAGEQPEPVRRVANL